jgi:hypothetical protein
VHNKRTRILSDHLYLFYLQISERARDLLQQQAPRGEFTVAPRRGILNVKGKGLMRTFWLLTPGGPDPDTLEEHVKD